MLSDSHQSSQAESYPDQLSDPVFADHAEMINAVIMALYAPDDPTNVAMAYDNNKNLPMEVQAYAKIAGRSWTYYVKSLGISFGRNTEAPLPTPVPSAPTGLASHPQPSQTVDIDLGPAKVVSRQHASIVYNLDRRCWELLVSGRNGARVDGQKVQVGPGHSTVLHSGAILDIGGTQMMFILPDSPAQVLPRVLPRYLARIKEMAMPLRHMNSRSGSVSEQGMHPQYAQYPQGTSEYNTTYLHRPPLLQHLLTQLVPPPPWELLTGQGNVANGLIPPAPFEADSHLQTLNAAAASSLQTNLDEDLSRDDARNSKPPYSYATMITQAILSDPEGALSLLEIYSWISLRYSYYRHSKTGWQNSIRHNLSLNKAFEKTPRRPSEPGKGMKWQISEAYKRDFMERMRLGPTAKTRRGSSVSRQLQLHLATHKHLPEYLRNRQVAVSPEYYAHIQQITQQFGLQPPQHLQQQGLWPSHLLPPEPKTEPPFNYPHAARPGEAHQNGADGGSNPAFAQQGPQKLLNNPTSPTANRPAGMQELASPIRPPQKGRSSHDAARAESPEPISPGRVEGVSADGSDNAQSRSSLDATQKMGMDSSKAIKDPELLKTREYGLSSLGHNESASPRKPLIQEAFTPDRSAKPGLTLKSGAASVQPPQSSPAFWNFVQFSTPNAPLPLHRGSPTSLRKRLSPTDPHESPSNQRGSSVFRVKGKDAS